MKSGGLTAMAQEMRIGAAMTSCDNPFLAIPLDGIKIHH